MGSFAVKGDLAWTESPDVFRTIHDGYVTVEDGKIASVSGRRPDLPVEDYSGCLIIPGLSDLHLHAPQYVFMGMHMDEELLAWLERHTFPIEAMFRDKEFARKAYEAFAAALLKTPTTRLSVFGTIFTDTTLMLMEILEDAGFAGYAGKVNMDRNSPDFLSEDTDESIAETERFIRESRGFRNMRPAITPRFIPSCSASLLRSLGRIAAEEDLPIQSHLDENLSEVEWVRLLVPEAPSYAVAYDQAGLLTDKTVMAHCVWPSDDEIALLAERGTYVAHSPSSNMNLSSGIAPMRRIISGGVRAGLATDVAGGSSLSMLRMISDAVQCSKLRWRLIDGNDKPLALSEAFYLASKGGGSFFGRTGSFEKGYDADIVVLGREADAPLLPGTDIPGRLERMIYASPETAVRAKYIKGVRCSGS